VVETRDDDACEEAAEELRTRAGATVVDAASNGHSRTGALAR
jgi:hypothetical protein